MTQDNSEEPMTQTITLHEITTFELIHCASCHAVMAVPVDRLEALRKYGSDFYCLSGHRNAYSETEADRLRKTVQREKAARSALEDQVAAAERERKRQEKRAKAGVCPCCHRSYVQVARHMKTKHPEYATA